MTTPMPRQTECIHPLRTPVPRLSTADHTVEDCQLCPARLTTDTRTHRTTVEVNGR